VCVCVYVRVRAMSVYFERTNNPLRFRSRKMQTDEERLLARDWGNTQMTDKTETNQINMHWNHAHTKNRCQPQCRQKGKLRALLPTLWLASIRLGLDRGGKQDKMHLNKPNGGFLASSLDLCMLTQGAWVALLHDACPSLLGAPSWRQDQ